MRFWLHIVLLAGAAIAANAVAQQYPARPVRIYIPFTAGSAADIIARALEPQMREKLGQSLIIDNRGGAGGNIAAELTAKSPADGYSVMMGTVGTHAINYSLYSKLPYHPQRDFTPIALVGESPNILVINPYVPAQSIKELIALGKANPGKLNYGSSGSGTTVHLSAELFSVMTGIKMVHVPYKGASEALTALLVRPDRSPIREPVVGNPACEGGTAARVCRDRRETLAVDSRNADDVGSGAARLCGLRVVRPARPRRHAARRRHSFEQRRARLAADAGGERPVVRLRRGAAPDAAGRIYASDRR